MFFGDLLLLVLIVTGIAVVSYFLNRRLLTLLISSIFLLLVAMRLNVPYMYLMGTVLLSLPFASYAVGWLGARKLDVTRSLSESAFEGETVSVRVDVYSPLALFSSFVRVNRHTPRHIRYVAGSERTTPIPGGTRHEYDVRPDRRGLYRLAGCNISVHDPLGIFVITRRFPLSSSLTVYPTGLSVQDMRSLGETTGGWLVQTKPRRRGDEEGFYGTREYRVGDDLRRIHWRSSARKGALVVVEREQGASGRLWLALDVRQGCERGTDRDSTLERSIKTAVSLMEVALQRGDVVGLLAPSPSGGIIPPAPGEAQRWRILETLSRVQADGVDALPDAIWSAGIESGSTVVVLTGAPTEEMVGMVPRLMDSGIGVVAAPVVSSTPARTSAYPVVTGEAFAASVEETGGGSLIIRPPVFEAASPTEPAPEAVA